MFSTARIGTPAVTTPTTGMRPGCIASGSAMVRFFMLSIWISPSSRSAPRW